MIAKGYAIGVAYERHGECLQNGKGVRESSTSRYNA